jgi:SNF2 family DNA or RNA helicase
VNGYDSSIGVLVRWPASAAQQLGVISKHDGRRVTVEFDDGQSRMFSLDAAPLERVELKGQVVRRSTTEAGFIVEGPNGTPPVWKVAFLGAGGAFRTKSVPEADLRPYVATSPIERMTARQTAGPKKANLALVARHYDLEHRTNELVSLGQARVDLKPYQVSVVHRVVTSYPHRFLLCDEVGLGKTIEAGMILKELRARGQAKRTLIIVPPNLVRQWQFELRTKFNETFSVFNTNTVRYIESTGDRGNPFASHDSVIVSSSWITYGSRNPELVTQVDWDMIILDEAHHARQRRYGNKVEMTQLYRLMHKLAAPGQFSNRALLMLTATPMQLETHELYSLVELLDPALFPSAAHFEAHRRRAPGLNQLVDNLRQHGFPPPDEAPTDTVSRVAAWLGIDEELAAKRLRAGSDEIETVCDDLAKQHLLSEVLIRNRKSVVGGFMPRRAHRWEVELTLAETSALDAVEDYVTSGWDRARRTGDNATGFVMTIFQKLMASSIRALRQSLIGRRDRLLSAAGGRTTSLGADWLLDDDIEATRKVIGLTGTADAPEIAELALLIDVLSSVDVDSKAQVLIEQLSTIFEHAATDRSAHDCPNPASHEKILIFTEFRETQNYLRRLMIERGWAVQVFHGQMSPERKDAAVDGFRKGTGPQILISTEAGGEGRNFQFCQMLVNYDLPWNPMRVEQRIGRVDRIGQDHVVDIFNLWVRGTIEERVLDVLERRINIFEDTVGGLDPILGETEKDLRTILKLRDEERDRALARLEENLEIQIRHARAAEVKLRDFIMETKSFSRQIAERIAGQHSPIAPDDQERFVTQLLADVNTWIGPIVNGEREIVFHEPFISDYREFSRDGVKRRIVFRADEVRDVEHVEYFAFGHPIVDTLLQRVLDEAYEGNSGTQQMLADDGLSPVAGWLCSYVVSVPGLKSVEELHPVFVTDDLQVDEDLGWKLVHRAAQFHRGSERAIPEQELSVDTLEPALERAEATITLIASELLARVVEDSRKRADRERKRLNSYFDYRERAARDRMKATRATVERLVASASEDDSRVVPLWRSNLERDERLVDELARERHARVAEIDQRLSPSPDWFLASLARVEILARP